MAFTSSMSGWLGLIILDIETISVHLTVNSTATYLLSIFSTLSACGMSIGTRVSRTSSIAMISSIPSTIWRIIASGTLLGVLHIFTRMDRMGATLLSTKWTIFQLTVPSLNTRGGRAEHDSIPTKDTCIHRRTIRLAHPCVMRTSKVSRTTLSSVSSGRRP